MLPDIQTILYCTQMGPNSTYVFRWTAALAEKLDARIVVLHVIERLSSFQESLVEGYAGKGKLHALVDGQDEEAVERLQRRIEAFCVRVAGDAFDPARVAKIVVAHGRVRKEILRQVEESGADLVVMGAHGRSSLLEGLTGTSTQQVTSSSPVPVLVIQVPDGQQEFTMLEP